MNPSLANKADEVFLLFGSVAYCATIFEADLKTMIILTQRLGRLDLLLKDQLDKDPFRLLNREGVDAFWLEAGERIESDLSRTTLGQLLKQSLSQTIKNLRDVIKAGTSIIHIEKVNEIVQILEAIPLSNWVLARDRRNYLFHEFFFQREIELCNDVSCVILADELRDDKTLFDHCVVQVRSITRSLLKVLGIDEETFSSTVSVEVKRLFSEAHVDATKF